VILVVVGGVGTYLILNAGAPEEDLSWAPTISPYVDDRAGVMTDVACPGPVGTRPVT
jgi:hypothetical protein